MDKNVQLLFKIVFFFLLIFISIIISLFQFEKYWEKKETEIIVLTENDWDYLLKDGKGEYLISFINIYPKTDEQFTVSQYKMSLVRSLKDNQHLISTIEDADHSFKVEIIFTYRGFIDFSGVPKEYGNKKSVFYVHDSLEDIITLLKTRSFLP